MLPIFHQRVVSNCLTHSATRTKKGGYTTSRCAIPVDSGRDWTRTNDLTDVNRKIPDRVRDVILLVVEFINN